MDWGKQEGDIDLDVYYVTYFVKPTQNQSSIYTALKDFKNGFFNDIWYVLASKESSSLGSKLSLLWPDLYSMSTTKQGVPSLQTKARSPKTRIHIYLGFGLWASAETLNFFQNFFSSRTVFIMWYLIPKKLKSLFNTNSL